ncbi:hypothetical protein BKA64DRAFT_702424 [Cadophora sp. MPI-SDFR-AT-0126]|nr:hypothetical protein BKA64DRAFT_702424 [Leotiomycetes sp. MPI-SDFR-AT-0126]
MLPTNTTLQLATEDDASTLASITTAAFSTSDAAYPLIWGSAPEGTHDTMCIIGLFSPVQKADRITYKAVDEDTQTVVGFATWSLPKVLPKSEDGGSKKEEGGLPPIPGVNVDLWVDKVRGTRVYSARDVDLEKDMDLTFCFVHPQYQRQGIASSLLGVGSREADKRKARFWCTSTPQAVSTYEKNGWKVVETHDVDLGKYGGEVDLIPLTDDLLDLLLGSTEILPNNADRETSTVQELDPDKVEGYKAEGYQEGISMVMNGR